MNKRRIRRMWWDRLFRLTLLMTGELYKRDQESRDQTRDQNEDRQMPLELEGVDLERNDLFKSKLVYFIRLPQAY